MCCGRGSETAADALAVGDGLAEADCGDWVPAGGAVDDAQAATPRAITGPMAATRPALPTSHLASRRLTWSARTARLRNSLISLLSLFTVMYGSSPLLD